MAKLDFEPKVLENDVLPYLDSALNFLNSAIKNIGNLDIPEDFMYSKYLKNLTYNNSITFDQLMSKKEKINQIIKDYESVQIQNQNAVIELKGVEILPRKKIVNHTKE